MMFKYLLVASVFAVTAIVGAPAIAGAAVDQSVCTAQLNKIKYRAEILGVKRSSEIKTHNVFHKKWQQRISYAGQWVPGSAKETRDSLYKADSLHAAKISEIDKQIAGAIKLRETKLTCSENASKIAKQNTSFKGTGVKPLQGDALIVEAKKKETVYKTGEFTKQSQKMLKDLHKKKEKKPQPPESKLPVK